RVVWPPTSPKSIMDGLSGGVARKHDGNHDENAYICLKYILKLRGQFRSRKWINNTSLSMNKCLDVKSECRTNAANILPIKFLQDSCFPRIVEAAVAVSRELTSGFVFWTYRKSSRISFSF